MNRLRGKITGIESNDHVSLVDVEVTGDIFTATLLETPEDSAYLRVGRNVDVLFKETEVSLARNLSGMISLRNRLRVTVIEVRCGVILGEVRMKYHDSVISSIITTRSIRRMAIAAGDELEAMIKANEVTLAEVTSGS